jgi:phosphoglucosamine mutase
VVDKRQYFGTDGIRGRVGDMPMQPEFLVKLGWAIGKTLSHSPRGRVVVGKDTRLSGYLLESAVEAGLAAAGVDTYLLGPMPTPAIAYITRVMEFDAGIVLSASHNPFYDNGLKIFTKQGIKLSDELEIMIEQKLAEPLQMVDAHHLGKAYRIEDALRKYIEFCKAIVPTALPFKGLKVVVDCANGAAYYLAPVILSELGVDVIAINAHPDGLNINDHCGAIHPQGLQDAVKKHHADLGIAFDGDADRVIMVDETGELVDGDELLYIIAMHQKQQQRLQGGVVGTLMTNLALEQAFLRENIPFSRAKVGDRYVLAQLQQSGWQIGGESSGHLIHLGYSTTGDGILSAILVLSALLDENVSLKEARARLVKYPQKMINVKLTKPFGVSEQQQLDALVQAAELSLGNRGRILLRLSGTEPLLRVMVEGEDMQSVNLLATELAEKVEQLIK